MSLYDTVSKKNYKIILYTYDCKHYYLIKQILSLFVFLTKYYVKK
jgi:hypothetical protein